MYLKLSDISRDCYSSLVNSQNLQINHHTGLLQWNAHRIYHLGFFYEPNEIFHNNPFGARIFWPMAKLCSQTWQIWTEPQI